MNFSRERYSPGLVHEMMPLWEAHHAETASKFYGPLDPDLTMYQHCDLAGMLRIFTVRQAGLLIGYQVFVIAEHPHSKDWITATQDILYLDPAHRRGVAGYRFLKWCENQLREDGISVMHQRVPVRMGLGNLFVRMGFELEDFSYSKVLQEAN